MASSSADDLTDTSQIKHWRSIVTLIVFVITNLCVIFPFTIPFYVPTKLVDSCLDGLASIRIIPKRQYRYRSDAIVDDDNDQNGKVKKFTRFNFPINFVTAPLIADLFLLAILAIGRKEVHDGTIGADNISPIDILTFFITLAYIAISLDASGIIRYLAFKVLQLGGKVGHRLFFFLYAFFFLLASFIGNDPIILSGTAFLAYMTRVSSNIVHPRAWIHTQFAVANIASAILVSSNPTNLVLAGAFKIKFIHYTANMIVPVVVTGIVLFPFLLYIVFANEALIPYSIKMHELPEEARGKKPINPNIPHARGNIDENEADLANDERGKLLSLEEIMNPFLDTWGATFGAGIMAVTLVTVLALNAASQKTGEHPVFWVTLPAAFVMFCWDLGFGWYHRKETRELARKGREEFETARFERAIREAASRRASIRDPALDALAAYELAGMAGYEGETDNSRAFNDEKRAVTASSSTPQAQPSTPAIMISENTNEHLAVMAASLTPSHESESAGLHIRTPVEPAHQDPISTSEIDSLEEKKALERAATGPPKGLFVALSAQEIERTRRNSFVSTRDRGPKTLVSLSMDLFHWCQETFPTATAVAVHLPFPLVPFAFCMFVLVQGLVTKGWVPVFAYGWDHWVNRTGTVGAIGGMGFVSVILCNFAGTNIGTTILLSRMIQAWSAIHEKSGVPISDRTFWATVYSMALGVNYGAFSAAFSASLAGLLWRDILGRKHIRVRSLEFARVNLPIISIAMAVGCAVLVGEVYIVRGEQPYKL